MPGNFPRDSTTRASWKGQIHIDLVSFPVTAYNVLVPEAGNIHFRQLHLCHTPIQHQKVCPIHGPVPNDEILSGYEYAKGKFVEFEPEELGRLRSVAEKVLTIDTFIAPEELDPIYFDGRAFYLAPDGEEAKEPYAVFRAAMERTERWGIGEVVLAEREQLVLLRPVSGVLTMAMLRQYEDLRPPAEIDVHKLRSSPENVRLAEELIDAAVTERLDLASYEDPYRQRIEAAIRSKLEHRPIPVNLEERRSRASSLRDALQRSLEAERRDRIHRHRNGVPTKS